MFGSRSRSRYSYDDVPVRRARSDPGRHVVVTLIRLVNLLFGVIYAIVGLRIVLEMLAAHEGNRFKELVDRLSAPLLGIFTNLLPPLRVGSYVLPLSFLFALIIYALIHYGIRRLLLSMDRSRSY